MKTFTQSFFSNPAPSSAASKAFTLAETMITLAIFSLVVLAMVSLQLFGFKINAITKSKLKATAYSLKTLNHIRRQVRGASSVSVGDGNNTSFTNATDATGNALQIYPTTNTSDYIRFYLVTNTLFELTNAGTPIKIAFDITNQDVFQMVDFQGNVLTNSQEHYAIEMTLQFAQMDYLAPTDTYDYYTLQTIMTPRIQ